MSEDVETLATPPTCQAPIPLTVVGGYLGAGKTTLLNHVLRHSGGRRYAVLVNDFGSLNIDASLIENRDGDVVRLDNGCLCCSLVGGLAAALHRLQGLDPRPEHVIIEASGVADPTRLGHYAFVAPFTPAGVLVVADAETVREKALDPFVGDAVLRQLRGGDLVVLNKTDLVDETALAAVADWLRSTVPDARHIEVSHGQIPTRMLLESTPARHPEPALDDAHTDLYASWSLSTEQPLRESAFRAQVASWPREIVRAKGVVFLADDADRRHVFQLVGRRWSLTPEQPWSDAPRTDLVIIALRGPVEGEALLAALQNPQEHATGATP